MASRIIWLPLLPASSPPVGLMSTPVQEVCWQIYVSLLHPCDNSLATKPCTCVCRLWRPEERRKHQWIGFWSLHQSVFKQTLPAFFSLLSGNNQLLSFHWRSASRSQMDETYKREQKFLISDKENVSAKRDTETLLLAKDSGKHFSRGLHLGGQSNHTALFWTTYSCFAKTDFLLMRCKRFDLIIFMFVSNQSFLTEYGICCVQLY